MEHNKLPFELVMKMDDMKQGIYHIEDAEENSFARVAGEGNARLLVDSVNKVQRYKEALAILLEAKRIKNTGKDLAYELLKKRGWELAENVMKED